MIAQRVADVEALNQAARRRLAHAGMLTGPEITAAGRSFQAGDRVVARRNQQLPTIDGTTAQVMNGQRGTITAIDPARRAATVAWDGRGSTTVPASYLDAAHLDHGYAITGHRAQGLTVDHTWIKTGDTLYREWGYVAASRGRHHSQLYAIADTMDATAEELDHGAWQPAAATTAQRLSSQLRRSHAHVNATDARRERPPARRFTLPTPESDQALGFD